MSQPGLLASVVGGWFSVAMPALLVTSLLGALGLVLDRLLRNLVPAGGRSAWLAGTLLTFVAAPAALLCLPSLAEALASPLTIRHDGPRPLWPSAIVAAWAVGALLAAAALVLRALRLRRVLRRSVAAPPRMQWAFRRARRRSGVASAGLRVSAETAVPFAAGVRQGVVVLPAGLAGRLPARQLEAVLRHELAHLRHRDVLLEWARAVIAAVWWFHPLLPLLARGLARATEERCDEEVVADGAVGEGTYARALLQVATLASERDGLLSPGPAMFRRQRGLLLARVRRLDGLATRAAGVRFPPGRWMLVSLGLGVLLTVWVPRLHFADGAGGTAAPAHDHAHAHRHHP